MSTKEQRTKKLRHKRPALASIEFELLSNELYEISGACGEVQYFFDDNGETLLNALDGDDEAEYEFRMAFSDLSGKAEQLSYAIQDWNIREYFDTCIVALVGNRYKTTGYDMEEEDYFSLTGYEQELAYTESGQKLMRKTKQEIISIVGQCLGILLAFFDVRHSFDYLKATFDILRDENTSILKIVKDIEDAYNAAADKDFISYYDETRRFETIISYLPDRLWLES